MADIVDLKSTAFTGVRVRVPPSAQKRLCEIVVRRAFFMTGLQLDVLIIQDFDSIALQNILNRFIVLHTERHV